MDKELLKKESATLKACPFCGGKARFYCTQNDKAPLHIQHLPEPGINCPARYDQFCETFDQGREWWNTRTKII